MKHLPAKILLLLLAACGGGGGGDGVTEPAIAASYVLEPYVINLSFPVGIAAAPDGSLFYTELKSGRVRIIRDGQIVPVPFASLELPSEPLEGTLGVTLDSDFLNNHFVYIFSATGKPIRNQVLRFRESGGLGTEATILLDNIPNGGHNGGKMVSAKSGELFVSTGDAGFPDSAQSVDSLAGKILRINREGGIPGGNISSESPVFALGFRNVFGISIDPRTEKIYASDNGPDCDDEINIVEQAGNYGWRASQLCGDQDPSYLQPVERLNPPLGISGIAFYQGSVFPELSNRLLVGDFNTGSVRQYYFREDGGQILDASVLLTGAGNGILEIAVAPDGNVYISLADGIYRLKRVETLSEPAL